jgi:hypothetical protein
LCFEWIDDAERLVRGGITYSNLLHYLKTKYKVDMSLAYLKGILRERNIFMNEAIPEALLDEMVAEESKTSGLDVGYRGMTVRIRNKYQVNVSRQSVSDSQGRVNPNAKHDRKGRRLHRFTYLVPGPNYMWHVDGYDKLSRFGFPISGCVDGFSRKLLWLRAVHSNKLPEVILSLYVDAVEQASVLPNVLRIDPGTENVHVKDVQLRAMGENSCIEGSSTRNQRIERLWRDVRQGGMEFWRQMFHDLALTGVYDYCDLYQVLCAQYVFGPMIESDLFDVLQWWNYHTIRATKNTSCGGIPTFLYENPPQNYQQCGSPMPDTFKEEIQQQFVLYDTTEEDTFFLQPYHSSFIHCLEQRNMLPITKDNMVDAFVCLKQSDCTREECSLITMMLNE